MRLGKVGTESDGFRTQDLDANTEFRHSAFSRAVSAVRPFEVMEGEHTPETDFIGCHQDLEEGERFESSDLRISVCSVCPFQLRIHLYIVTGMSFWSQVVSSGSASLPFDPEADGLLSNHGPLLK